jgi:hypothetical protein|tara:strand:- start:2175 stop:3278 length:1104 start_codon:yes stop_codon:yes gene_type:complete
MKKIAIVAKTAGLEYDDRIRKESIALSKENDVCIYVVFDDNRHESGITSYGIKYRSFSLRSRKIFPQSKFLIIKALEYYFVVKKYLKNADFVWAHEEYSFLFPLLVKKNKCIWDLHEIPKFFNNFIMKKVFHFIEKRAYKIIHANEYRIKYLISEKTIQFKNKHTYLNNFPDRIFLESKCEDEKFLKFKKWLNESDYIYLQGLSYPQRNPINTIESVIRSRSKAIVVGNIDSKAYKYLKNKYPNFNKYIFETGMVDQLNITKYIDKSKFTIIIYDSSSPNNIFCEPNRLYQSLSLAKPAIVSQNPPMKSIIDRYDLGVVLKSYGEDKEELLDAIKNINKNYERYRSNLFKNKERFIWKDKSVNEIIL